METSQIESVIVENVRKLTQHPSFLAWKESKPIAHKDIILINNSFVFRDVKTIKAKEFLSIIDNEETFEDDIAIARGIQFNVDFKHISSKSTNLQDIEPLSSQITPQLEKLGQLVFLLIGEILDTEIIEVHMNHSSFSTVAWDPTMQDIVRIETDRILVSRTDDEDLVWNILETQLQNEENSISEGLKEALGVALDKLQDHAVAHVRIPQPGEEIRSGMTDAILVVLREQRDEYSAAISELGDSNLSVSSLNDILRIAYNFASDATGYLRLIVSICDLKPVVLWGTIAEHYTLSEAFNSLPWSRSRQKASLKNYTQSIADARNSAFHNLFPFRKSLRVPLSEEALGTPELQLFSEHTKKKNNQLTYDDKALVDVLLEFTRARERRLPLSFWQKYLDVMNATITLFESTSRFLKTLATARLDKKSIRI
jgi:hypothetical protein